MRISWLLLAAPLLAQTPLKLADLERMALEANPSIAAAQARVRAAEGRVDQAGRYPNPMITASGEEISNVRGGYGGFIEQRIVMAGKLARSRAVAREEQAGAAAMTDTERLRIRNSVRLLYYQALGEQRLIEVRTELSKLADRSAGISRELGNIGQADKPDELAAQVEAGRIALSLESAKHAQQRTWSELAALVNQPQLPIGPLEGDLEAMPQVDVEAALARLFAESPELKMMKSDTARADAAVSRARVEKVPDLMVKAGVRNNTEQLDRQVYGRPGAIGAEGFFEVGVEIPIFDRNRGGIAAAKADAERARQDEARTRIALRMRLAEAYREYRNAVTMVTRYRDEMIPKARQAFDLYTASFERMSAAYPQVLMSQRNLVQLQEDYIGALVMAWQRALEIDGLLVGRGEMMP